MVLIDKLQTDAMLVFDGAARLIDSSAEVTAWRGVAGRRWAGHDPGRGRSLPGPCQPATRRVSPTDWPPRI